MHPEAISGALGFRIRLFRFIQAFSTRHRWINDVFDNDDDSVGRDAGNFDGLQSRQRAKRRYPKSQRSLQRLLPMFLALSASSSAWQGIVADITHVWMEMAAGFMLHAALEYAAVLGSSSTEVVDKFFHWTFREDNAAEEGSDEFIVNAMFFDAEIDGPNQQWIKVRNEYRNEVGNLSRWASSSHLIHFQARASSRHDISRVRKSAM